MSLTEIAQMSMTEKAQMFMDGTDDAEDDSDTVFGAAGESTQTSDDNEIVSPGAQNKKTVKNQETTNAFTVNVPMCDSYY